MGATRRRGKGRAGRYLRLLIETLLTNRHELRGMMVADPGRHLKQHIGSKPPGPSSRSSLTTYIGTSWVVGPWSPPHRTSQIN